MMSGYQRRAHMQITIPPYATNGNWLERIEL